MPRYSARPKPIATAVQESGRLADAQDRMRERAEEMISVQRDFVGSIVQGFAQGTKASEVFSGALASLGQRLIDLALDDLFRPSSKGGLGFNLLSIFGLGRRAVGGAAMAGKPIVVGEHRPEVFVPNSNGRIIPQVPTLPDLSAMQGAMAGPQITFAPQIDARGASVEAVARLEQVMTQQRQDFEANVISTMRKAKKSNIKGI